MARCIATPWSVEFDGSDLKIGADEISVREVEQVLTRVLEDAEDWLDTGESAGHAGAPQAAGTHFVFGPR
jgi:hypothetical protein